LLVVSPESAVCAASDESAFDESAFLVFFLVLVSEAACEVASEAPSAVVFFFFFFLVLVSDGSGDWEDPACGPGAALTTAPAVVSRKVRKRAKYAYTFAVRFVFFMVFFSPSGRLAGLHSRTSVERWGWKRPLQSGAVFREEMPGIFAKNGWKVKVRWCAVAAK